MLTTEQINNPESLYYKACDVIKGFNFKTTFEDVCNELKKLGHDVSDDGQIYHALDWAHQWTDKPLY